MNKIENNDRRLIIKTNKKNPFISFWNWGWNIYYNNVELYNYLIVGFLTMIIALAIKWGLYFSILDVNNASEAQIGVIVSWIIAVLFAYITNRIFVFKSNNKHIAKELFSFVGSRIITYFLEALLTWLFYNILGLTSNTWIIIVTIIIQILVTILNYIFSKLFVFKR